jgi:hypothetical protein
MACEVTKLDGGWHGEGEEHASGVLGRGSDHGGVHPQPCVHEGPKRVLPQKLGCIGHVKKTKSFLTKLEDRSTSMVLLGHEEGSKAYLMFDLKGGKVVISRDVVFNKMVA